MTRWIANLTVALLVVGAAATAADTGNDASRVQADARRLLDATYTADIDTMMELTHAALIEQLGGRDKARETYTTALEQVKKVGLKIDKFEFPAPPAFVEGKGRTYAIVPTRIVVSAGAQTLDRRGFQVGVRDPIDGKWTYVEGAKFDAALRAKYFPDFPKDYEFPETSGVE